MKKKLLLKNNPLQGNNPHLILPHQNSGSKNAKTNHRFSIFAIGVLALYARLLLAVVITTLLLAVPDTAFSQTGKTFIVNTPGDSADFDEFDGMCDTDPFTPGEQCTFRAAIQNHNFNRNLDQNRIRFEIPNAPGTGSIVIEVGSTGLGALPPILGAVTIQALNSVSSTDPTRRIELDGTAAGPNAIGLELLGEHCEISFFIINSFSSHGMHLSGTPFSNGGHKISSMRIGTDSTGKVDKGNGGHGIFVEDVPNNTIGGATLLDGCVIGGNGGVAINILGRDPDSTGFPLSGAPGNKLFHNFIGISLSDDVVLPNDEGAVLIDNAREVLVGEMPLPGEAPSPFRAQGKGNTIDGVKNGITVTGSLSKGIRLEGNAIGKDGTVAKLLVGIFARPGELFSAVGNIITNVGEASMDLFFDASSKYVIKQQEINNIIKAGTIIKFAENRVIEVEFRSNSHVGAGVGATTGVRIEESLRGTINWVIDSNRATNCQTGSSITFRSSGEKNFSNNHWDFNVGVGIEYINEFAPGAVAKINVNNEFAVGNGAEGFKGLVKLEATAEVTVNLFKIIGSRNGKDGLSFALVAEAGARSVFNLGGESELDLNGSLGFRIVGEKASIDVFVVEISKSSARDNIEGACYLFNVKLPFSLTENTIANNGGPGIRLGGSTEARIDGNTISGNGIGIITEDEAIATISNNTLTGNGKAVVLLGTGAGTALSSNSIFNNIGLGIDLNNDGVTLNDNGDADTGPNGLQNFPVLTAVSSTGGNTIINGSLNSSPNSRFRIEYYANAVCNGAGFGEGQTFLGFDTVETDAGGNVTFSTLLSGIPLSHGTFVTATATDTISNTSEFSACSLFGTAQSADIELVKQADKSQLTIGEQVIFTIKLTNKGPDAAANIAVKDIVPAGITISQSTSTTGSYDAGTGVWSVSALNSGGEATLSITGTATAVGTIINTAEVIASGQPDPDSSPNNQQAGEDDQSSVSVEVQPVTLVADLELVKTSNKSSLGIGETVTFTITLSNKGPDAATGITVADLLPAGLSFNQATPSLGSYNSNTGIWSINTLNGGGQATLTITATATQPGIISNVAEVMASDQPDPDSSPGNGGVNEDDRSSVSVTILAATDISNRIRQLMAEIDILVESGELSNRNGNQLNRKLQRALNDVENGNSKRAIRELVSFNINIIILIIKSDISIGQGINLILEALKIIDLLKETPLNLRSNTNVTYFKKEATKGLESAGRLGNYPNPFRKSTMITFELDQQSKVDLTVYDIHGRLITHLFNGFKMAGKHEMKWQPGAVPAGVYLLRLKVDNEVQAKQMILFK